MTPPFIRATRTPTGFRGVIILNGEQRWSRVNATAEGLARSLQLCYPAIDHVECETGVQDTGCLTLAECIEASAA